MNRCPNRRIGTTKSAIYDEGQRERQAACPTLPSNREEKLLNLAQPGRGLLFREARELSGGHNVIAIARDHQFAFLRFDGRHVAGAGKKLDLHHLEQQFNRLGQDPKTIAQFVAQAFE